MQKGNKNAGPRAGVADAREKKKMGVGRIIRWRLLTGLAFGVKILVGEDPV